MSKPPRLVPLTFLMVGLASWIPVESPAQPVADQPDAASVTADKWPKTAKAGGTTYTVYQPQLEAWDGYQLKARSVVSLVQAGSDAQVFGIIGMEAATDVDRQSRAVRIRDIKVTNASFPSAPQSAAGFQGSLQQWLAGQTFTPSLDRMQAALAVDAAASQITGAPVANPPPRFIFSESAAALVHVDGEPVWRPVEGTQLKRVLNTRALILADAAGTVYLHILDGFVEAPAITGPWTAARKVPASATSLAQSLAKANVVDLMEGTADEKTKKRPSLAANTPRVFVATTATELIVTSGAAEWAPLDKTSLLYVKNTTGNVFKHLKDQATYVLVTGRWFKAPDLSGPWQYVEAASLPSDFSSIPDDSPKENIKASIPGTRQALEASIANQIPQTARIDRAKATFAPQISGTPDMKAIAGTPLTYVSNSPSPIIQVAPTEWYAVHNAVWFVAPSPTGPWMVATAVPPAIYSIPPSSPVHYVTYLKIYDVGPNHVVVGYTPGYMGTIVASNGLVVYGTGYSYAPYIGPTVWYSAPVTYGYAANPTWTPWTGWAVGFGIGWALGASSNYCCYAAAPYWGAMPYAPYSGAVRTASGGGAAWGPSGWAATSGNVYQKWGPTTAVSRTSAGYNAWSGNAWSSKVGTSYNSTTGRVSAGQQAAVSNVYTGNYGYGQRGATHNPSTGVSARGGSATVGNAYTGEQTTAKAGQVAGPGGKSVSAAKVGNDAYAGADGNIYKKTGDSWQKYDSNGGWSELQKPATLPTQNPNASGQGRAQTPATQSLDAQHRARQAGDERSAAASWGSQSWGGGFEGGDKPTANRVAAEGQSWGGGQFGGGARGGASRRR
jgi:hypothetical protein